MIIDAQFAPEPDANISNAIITLTSSDLSDTELVEATSPVSGTPINFTVKQGEEVRIIGQNVDFPMIRHEGLGKVPITFSITVDQLYKILSDAGSPSVIFKDIKVNGTEEALIDYLMSQLSTEEVTIPSVDGFNALAQVNNSYLATLPITVDQIYIDMLIASMICGTEETMLNAENMIVVSGSVAISESLRPSEEEKAIYMKYVVEGAGNISQIGSAPVVNLPNYVPMNRIRTKIVATGTLATVGVSLALRTVLRKR